MAFLCETPDPKVQPTTSTVVNEIPAYEQEARKRLYATADQVASQPYTPYTGQRLADFTPAQQQAFGQVAGMQGSWLGPMAAAYGMTGQAAQQFPQANLGAYMNPYSQNVTDIAAREATRNAAIQKKSLQDQFTKSGSFGGYRQGVAESELSRNLGQQLDDIYLKGGQAAFTQAGQLFGADRDAALKAGNQFGTLAGQGQNLAFKDSAALQAVGDAQQAMNQANLTQGYQDFTAQRDYPREQTNWLANIIKGTTQQSGSTTQGQQIIPQASPISQIAGLGTTALGLYGLGTGLKLFGGSQGGHIKGYAEGGSVRGYANGGQVDYPTDLLSEIAKNSRDPATRAAATEELLKRGRGLGNTTGSAPGVHQALSRTLQNLAGFSPVEPPNSAEIERQLEAKRVRQESPQLFSQSAPIDSSGPLPPPAAPDPEVDPGPPSRAPGANGGAAAQPRRDSSGGGGGGAPRTTGSFYDQVRDRIFADDKPYVPLTKPVDVETPKTVKLDEEVSPWMAITRAGLGMMAAKPGQSALQAIGEGGLGGVEQLNRDIAKADKNKQGNYENNLKQADFYFKKASTENDRLVKERQLEQAQRQTELAKRNLELNFAQGMSTENYQKGMLEVYARQAGNSSANTLGAQIDALQERILAANPGMSAADAMKQAIDYTRGSNFAAVTRANQGRPTLTYAQASAEVRQSAKDDPSFMRFKGPEREREIMRRIDERMKQAGAGGRAANPQFEEAMKALRQSLSEP
jgi:hypothetical protein